MMNRLRKPGKAATGMIAGLFALGLTSIASAGNGPGFSPADPEPLLRGSAGFTDLSALAKAGRGDAPIFEETKGGFSCPNLKAASSILDSQPSPVDGLVVRDRRSGAEAEVDFPIIGQDARGTVFGIAEVELANGDTVEMPVRGRSRFREVAFIDYVPAFDDDKGIEQGTIIDSGLPFEAASIERRLNHRINIIARTRGANVRLNLADRDVLSDYFGLPLDFFGRLVVNVRGSVRGRSDVVVTGIIDEGAEFDISGQSLTVRPNLRNWTGDALLCTPYNDGLGTRGVSLPDECLEPPMCDAPLVAGGQSRFVIPRYYDGFRNRPAGRYKLVQRNDFEGSRYIASSAGWLLNTESVSGELVTGGAAISDLNFRATNHTFRTNASITRVRSNYDDSLLSVNVLD